MNQTRDARRDQVVSAVLKLIGEQGMSGFTTAAVAREVGMSEANLYRHFKNKQEILSETITRIGQGLSSNVDTVVKSSATPIDRLKNIFRLHMKYVGQNHGIPRLVFSDEIHAENPEMKAILLNMISSYADLLEGIIGEGKEQGSMKPDLDPRGTALTFIGMVQITILRWVLSDFKLSLEKEGLKLWNNFEKCLRTPSRSAGALRQPLNAES
ncbi:MAG: TetR/AcrR family transcriptional regulator [Syntrophorhabdaceae bacterium]